jgi:hypothetical protein
MTPAHRNNRSFVLAFERSGLATLETTGARITKMPVIASARWLEHDARTTLARIPVLAVPVAVHAS